MAKAVDQAGIDGVETIIDADAHVFDGFDDIVPYIDDEYAAAKRRIETSRDPAGHVLSATYTAPNMTSTYGDEKSNTTEVKLSHMDDFGIDAGYLMPSLMNAIGTVNNPRFATALANGYNSWMLDEFLDGNDNLKAGIVIGPQKPEDAAEEIDDRADEDGFAGIALPPGGLLPPAGHEKYDPIYQAAVDNDLPLVLHGTNNAFQSSFPTMFEHSETFYESHFFSHPYPMIWNLAASIIRGLPERYPGIEMVFQESGIGWVPYVKWRLDDVYFETSEEVPWLDQLPSEYIDESYYFTTQPLGHTAKNPQHLAWAIEMAGPENVMYSSDLPHPTFDPPSELYDRIKGHFDDDAIDAMMGGTAENVFGF